MREIDIRRALIAEVSRFYSAGDGDTVILEELGLCQGAARVDLAVVNGSLHGFEIKSDDDTLQRLPAQHAVYDRALDYITIVVGPTHQRKARAAVPQWWGLSVATERNGTVVIRPRRRARRNPNRDALAVAQLLWRDEALALLEERGLANGVRSRPRPVLWAKLADSLPVDEVAALVRDCLKTRVAWRPDALRMSGDDSSRPYAK